jgi:hypothetical protein
MHHPFELTIADLESIDLEPVDGATVELIVGGALDFLRSSSTNPLLNSMRQKPFPASQSPHPDPHEMPVFLSEKILVLSPTASLVPNKVAKPGKKRADLTVESEVLQPASLRLEPQLASTVLFVLGVCRFIRRTPLR